MPTVAADEARKGELLDWAEEVLGAGVLKDPSWRLDAACAESGTKAFFKTGKHAAPARKICEGCDVQMECLTVALATKEPVGIWGGLSAPERRRLRKALSARHPEWGLDHQELTWEAEPYRTPLREDERDSTPKTRRPHQVEAVNAAVAELADGGAAQVIMACGTGKTHVGLWTAEDLDSRLTLILAPSLVLVGQLLRMWRASTVWDDVSWLTVCSKEEAGGAVPATTDPEVARSFLKGEGRRVVIATYRSGPVLAATGVTFYLAIADEAHHTVLTDDGPDSALARGEIKAERRLYMTATPRSWRRGRDGVERVGMDNEAVYGRRVYDLSLGKAIEQKLVADYRIVLAAVDRETYAGLIDHPDLTGVAPSSVVAVVAILRTMAEYGLSRCVSFHSRIARAHEFSRLVGPIANTLDEAECPEGPGWSAWLHGHTPARTRSHLLQRLEEGDGWGIVSNARVLGEGLDITQLDSIGIVDPKHSETDVGQAVGRALRAASPDKIGTVILPVSVGEDGTITEESMEMAGSVLRALRAHDPELGERLDFARRAAGSNGGSEVGPRIVDRTLFGPRMEFRLPPGAASDLADAMTLRLVREASSTWEESFGLLQAWTAANGHACVPQGEIVHIGGRPVKLGTWVSTQRGLFKAGHLDDDRAAALAALAGWDWAPRAGGWQRQFEALASYAAEHGTATPHLRTEHEGVRIGKFINVVRQAYKAGDLYPERIAALESLPGWTWDVRRDAWDGHFDDLTEWVGKHGHARPSRGDLIGEDGAAFDLGHWVSKQRGNLRAGKLSAEQAALLRALPGWVDHERDAAWECGFEHLGEWLADHGNASPPQAALAKDGFAIGRWVAKQRSAKVRGSLVEARQERLAALAGWSWAPGAERDVFSERVAMVARFAAEHGHARVPDGFQADGMNLGAWVVSIRMQHRKGLLAPERVAALEALSGWAWSPHDAAWDGFFSALEAFAAREGHARVPGAWREGDLALGDWVERQRLEASRGRLSARRAQRLVSVPGWAWSKEPTAA